MSLSSAITDRISTARLAQLTNDRNSTSSGVNATRLGHACTDVEADFEMFGGAIFDVTLPVHVSLAVRGVVLKLQLYKGVQGFSEVMEQHRVWQEELKLLRSRSALPVKSSAVRSVEQQDADDTVELGHVFWNGYRAKGT